MPRSFETLVVCLLAALVLAGSGACADLPSGTRINLVAEGFDEPWGVAVLPDGGYLVTERGGRLVLVRSGGSLTVSGTPDVVARGQGGLLDITLARDFATSRTLFLTYSRKQPGGSGTSLASARLSDDGSRLEDLRLLFEMSEGSSGGRHFGSRVVEARDGTLYLTIGDRGNREAAQDPGTHTGAIVRITRQGAVPADNPFVGQAGIRPEIWSYGHRNPQGADIDAQGQLWTSEHGANGGDEVNRITKGANYGWPVISYGRHYSGARIGEGNRKPGMQQPVHYWDPSIAPSGLLVYTGDMFPRWRGDIFVGSLKLDYISRLDITGDTAREVAKISSPQTGRVRDIAQDRDGSLLFLSVTNGSLYRLTRSR